MLHTQLIWIAKIQHIFCYILPWNIEGCRTSIYRSNHSRMYRLYRTCYRHFIVIAQYVCTILIIIATERAHKKSELEVVDFIFLGSWIQVLLFSTFLVSYFESSNISKQCIRLNKQFTGENNND